MVDLYSFFQVDVWALGVSAIEMAEVFLLLVNVEHFRGSKKKKKRNLKANHLYKLLGSANVSFSLIIFFLFFCVLGAWEGDRICACVAKIVLL